MLWEKNLQYMVDNAVVTDDGSTCAENPYLVSNREVFQKLLIISPKGETKLDLDIESDKFVGHGAAQPNVFDMTASSQADTCTFLFRGGKSPIRTFQLSTGRETSETFAKINADESAVIRTLSYVPGTSLLLVLSFNFQNQRDASVYSLYDSKANIVWNKTIPGDQDLDEKVEYKNFYRQPQKAPFHKLSDHSFEIRLFKTAALNRFEIKEEAGKPTVNLVSQSAYNPPLRSSLRFPTIKLQQLPSIDLKSPVQGKLPAVNRINEFCIIDKNRFAHIISGGDKFQVFDRAGRQIGLHPMPLKDGRHWSNIVYAGKDTLVGVAQHSMGNHNTEFWGLNIKTGTRKLIASKPNSYVRFITSPQDGTFVYTASHLSNNDGQSILRLDINGKQVFRHYQPNGYSGAPSEVLSADSAVALADGTIAILESVGDRIVFFSAKGQYLRAIDLEKLLKSDQLYPTDLQLDKAGNFLFNESDKIFCVSQAGKILGSLTPKVDSGESWDWRFRALGDEIWATDQFQLYLIDKKGKATYKIGEGANAQRLRDVEALAVTADGTLFARDERTDVVHVFNRQGKWQRMEPKPNSNIGFNNGFAFTAPNSVFIGIRDENLLLMASDGKRTLRKRVQDGRPRFPKRMDGRWFSSEDETCYAPDGAFAILDGQAWSLRDSDEEILIEKYVSIYTSNSKARALFRLPDDLLPSSLIGFDGVNVYLSNEKGIYCFDWQGKPKWKANHTDGRDYSLSNGVIYYGHEGTKVGRLKVP